MIKWIRTVLENPVTLRDIGWKYAPPVLWVIPRPYFHLFIVLSLIAGFYGFYFYLATTTNSRDLFFVYTTMVAIGSSALLIILSFVGSMSSWRKDRELNRLPELILTGMDLKQLAHGKLIIGATPLILAGLFFTINLLPTAVFSAGIMISELMRASLWNWWRSIDDYWFQIAALPIVLTLLSISYRIYCSSVRLGFRRRYPLLSVLTQLVRKLSFLIFLTIMFMAFLLIMALSFEVGEDIALVVVLSAGLIFAQFAIVCETVIEYRHAMHSIIYHYNLQVDEMSSS